MLQTRRLFLQDLLATAIAAGYNPHLDVSAVGDVYRNKRLGLSLNRPSRWEFSSIADFVALLERQVVVDPVNEGVHPLKDPTNLPVFIFENPSGRDGLFVPSIALYDEVLDGPIPEDQPLAHELMLAGFAQSYRDLELKHDPIVVSLHGAMGTWSHWSYLHELDKGMSVPLSIRSLVVFREPRVHTFHFAESPSSPRHPDVIWSEFIRSISYEEMPEI